MALAGQSPGREALRGGVITVAAELAGRAVRPFVASGGEPVGCRDVPQRAVAARAIGRGAAGGDVDGCQTVFRGQMPQTVDDLATDMATKPAVPYPAQTAGLHRRQVVDVDGGAPGRHRVVDGPARGSPREGLSEAPGAGVDVCVFDREGVVFGVQVRVRAAVEEALVVLKAFTDLFADGP
nr:hypothetical protein [Actinoplanes regularis]